MIGKKWTLTENVQYCLFMSFYQDIFNRKKDRQCLRIFKKLSEFLGTRNPRQCRSHFQKLMNRFKVPMRAIKFYKSLYGGSQFDEEFLNISEKLAPLSCSKK